LNPAGEMFGHERLVEWLRSHAQSPLAADHLRDALATELTRFRGAAPLRDDQAFLLLLEEQAVVTDVAARAPLLPAAEIIADCQLPIAD